MAHLPSHKLTIPRSHGMNHAMQTEIITTREVKAILPRIKNVKDVVDETTNNASATKKNASDLADIASHLSELVKQFKI